MLDFDDDNELVDDEDGDVLTHRPMLVEISFPCSHTVEFMVGTTIPQTCPACDMGLEEGSTRCEDYPCCGHTDGDGCMPNPRHTSAYWSEFYSGMDEDEMNYADELMANGGYYG